MMYDWQGPGSICSDWNNALKAGFDVESLSWPEWLLHSELGGEIRHCLPEVRKKQETSMPSSYKA